MKTRAVLAIILALSSAPLAADPAVAVRVFPLLAFEPSDLTVSASVRANEDNRSIEIIAESDDYYRSSEIQLDGGRAPRTTSVAFRGLPSGFYTVRAILRGTGGKELAASVAGAHVVSRSAEP